MAKADIEIMFQGVDSSFGVPTYRPGELVRGTATVFPDSNVKCNHLFIRLVWYTEGRGTRYREMIEEMDVFQGDLQSGMPRSFDFQFPLPGSPWSHEGHYISVVWGVEVQVDVPWARDPKSVGNFLLEPERTEQSEW